MATAKVLHYDSRELETFLPHSQPAYISSASTTPATPIKVDIPENGTKLEQEMKGDFDPFKSRKLEHPVSSCGTLTHLLKSSLGSGILAMPAAFKASGLWWGVVATILVSIICTHCAYVLVTSAHALYKKVGKTSMTYPDVAEEACLRGPPWGRKFAFLARQIVLWGIFLTYFATGSCYAVIVAENFNYVAFNYITPFDKRITIGLLFLPFLLIAYVPNLKYLAPVSMVANVCMAVGLGITCYYLLVDIPSISERPAIANLSTLPVGISVVIFAIEAIGVVMPLENNMETPRKFIGIFGVLNQGMAFVTVLYIVLGFLGFLKYGEHTADSITLNLPKEEYAAQAVNVLVGLAVFFTYGLVFYVCLDIVWNEIKYRYSTKETFANYLLRTVMVIVNIVIAVLVPQIIPFVSLIGAFCFSILGLVCPVIIEILTFWEEGFGRFNWKIAKHAVIMITAMIAVIFGSRSAISDIIKTFQ
jgi:proton-coupled amino acid transporter